MPNVLFMAAEDLAAVLGCYGHPSVRTPNLDRLARRGVRFEHAYCQYPLCGPSRLSLLTGLRLDPRRFCVNPIHFRDFFPGAVTLPQLFRQCGYFSARVGKVFHARVPADIGTSNWDDPASWDEVVNPRGRDCAEEGRVRNLTPFIPIGGSLSYMEAGGIDEEQTDGMVAAAAIRFLEQNRTRPFFLAVGFYRPHVPLVAPGKYYRMYPLRRVRASPLTDDRRGKPSAALATVPRANYGLSEADCRRVIRAYHASTTFMDAQAGKVLDALQRLGLQENTIVIFWSDHGWHLGEHGLWQKMSLYEESVKVPLIVAVPGMKKRGWVCRRPVELLDLYPTLADLCGLPRLPHLQGKSFRCLLDNPSCSWKRPVFTNVKRGGVMGRSVRLGRWRYTEWNHGRKGAELYNLDKDPHQHFNLAGHCRCSETIKMMRQVLRRGERLISKGLKRIKKGKDRSKF